MSDPRSIYNPIIYNDSSPRWHKVYLTNVRKFFKLHASIEKYYLFSVANVPHEREGIGKAFSFIIEKNPDLYIYQIYTKRVNPHQVADDFRLSSFKDVSKIADWINTQIGIGGYEYGKYDSNPIITQRMKFYDGRKKIRDLSL